MVVSSTFYEMDRSGCPRRLCCLSRLDQKAMGRALEVRPYNRTTALVSCIFNKLNGSAEITSEPTQVHSRGAECDVETLRAMRRPTPMSVYDVNTFVRCLVSRDQSSYSDPIWIKGQCSEDGLF